MPTNTFPENLGRFKLIKELGRGAQGVVWQALDPKLERNVAVKVMHRSAVSEKDVQAWLGEARAVSRLSHAHIVPVFEADEDGGRAFLVFELVMGQTLDGMLQTGGALPGIQAVRLMTELLSALEYAHAAGVIHRDLKPGNILIDSSGSVRIMDFGAAVINRGPQLTQDLSGTLAYMSPEVLNGAQPSPASDLYSAGLIFYEMLTGTPAVSESDPYRVIYRLTNETINLPQDLPHALDDGLRLIVNRCISRDQSVRYANVSQVRKVLSDWESVNTGSGHEVASQRSGTMEFLLRRMRHKSDFPAMSDSISRIQKISQSDDENINSLANEILKDVALTNKILRLVNSTFYTSAGGGTISTVSRAVAVIGFTGIRNLAFSLVLLEHMQDKKNITQLREEFFRSLMAGIVASEFCPVAKETEEAFIAASFQNLGRLLTQYYFAEEADQIRQKLGKKYSGPDAASPPNTLKLEGIPSLADEEAAAVSVLGISFLNLGAGIAKTWDMPDSLVTAMRRLPEDVPVKLPTTPAERLRTIASAGNEMTEALLCTDPVESHRRALAVSERYAHAVGVASKVMAESVLRSQDRLGEVARSLAIPIRPGSSSARLLGKGFSVAPKPSADTQLLAASTDTSGASSTSSVTGPLNSDTSVGADLAAERLASGIQDISNSLVEDNFKLHEVLRMILETLLRSLDFQRVVFCLRDPKTGVLTGRIALGKDAETIAPFFKVKLDSTQDLFSAVCGKGADILISDATAANVANRIPSWYSSHIAAPSFLLLPLLIKSAPTGLIYADSATAGSIRVTERELSLLRTLRNQAIMALKQSHR